MLMRRVSTFLTVIIVCLFIVTGSMAAEVGALRITEMAVTTKISRNNPIDSVRRINHRSVPALYCFTRIVNPSGTETTIRHIWYRNGQVAAEQELNVKGKKWRTWSKRPIGRDSVGKWRVETLDSEGKLLKAVDFRIN
jgi:hypothetical protein